MAEIFGVAAGIVGLIQLTGKVTAVGYGYIAGVKRAPKELRDLVIELSSFTEVLSVLQDRIETNPELTTFQAFSDQTHGPLGSCIREMEELQSKLEPRGGFRGVMDNLQWPLKGAETLSYVSAIERYKSLFTLTLAVDHISISEKIAKSTQKTSSAVLEVKALTEDINNSTHSLHEDFQKVNLSQEVWRQEDMALREEKKRRAALEWLYNEPFDTKHIEISNKRQKNTGNWLFERREFKKWIKPVPDTDKNNIHLSVLWGYGIPGGGKTFLCSQVINHFEAQTQTENYGMAYMYFDFTEREQMPVKVFASLVKQLCTQLPKLPKTIRLLYDKLDVKRKRPTLNDLYEALLVIRRSFSRVYLIFDALDESDYEKQRKHLIPFLKKIAQADGFKIFITSRPYPEDIRDFLNDAIKIEVFAQEGDIRAYIEETIHENHRARRLVKKGQIKEKIMEELVDCAKGMFLLVRFHVEYLCQQTTAKQIITALEKIRSSSIDERPLDPTYNRVIESIHRQHKSCADLAFRVLSWLLKARRVLTVDEIRVAISIEPNNYELDDLNMIDRTTLLDVCAGLVTIDTNTDIIRLSHYTVQEYLINNLVTPNAELYLATACTTYLSFTVFASPGGSYYELINRDRSHPFLRYAAHYFAYHLMSCDEEETTDMLLKFLESPGNIASYFQALRPPPNPHTQGLISVSLTINERNPKRLYPLHLAATIGHYTAIRRLLEKGTNLVSDRDNEGQTALHRAIFSGSEKVVMLLLREGGKTSAVDHEGQTPLHLAALRGDEKLVRLLLAEGANIKAEDNGGRTPLDMVPVLARHVDSLADHGGLSPLAYIMIHEYRAKPGTLRSSINEAMLDNYSVLTPIGNPDQYIDEFGKRRDRTTYIKPIFVPRNDQVVQNDPKGLNIRMARSH